MCGILFDYKMGLDEALFMRCVERLIHRGPDQGGYWRDDLVQMGHRRLSIIDLSENGRQPMLVNDRYVIVFNGEIYNYIEIKRELQLKGYSFVTNTDTEVVCTAYIEYGEKALDKFNGMFAFVIWDTKNRKAFVARDRLGVKPLFVFEKDGRYLFASEMKALIPAISTPCINRQIVQRKENVLNYAGSGETPIRGIRSFPAGYYGVIENDKLILHRWWETRSLAFNTCIQYEDQVSLFRELFLDACKIRMRSDVKIGTALSGGLDSSSVASSMAFLRPGETQLSYSENEFQNVYVARFQGLPIDESDYARKVSDRYGLNIKYIDIIPDDFVKSLKDDLYYFEDVYITPPFPMMRVYEAMRRDSVYVTLDGHGADELFGGYDMSLIFAMSDTVYNPKRFANCASIMRDMYTDTGAEFFAQRPSWRELFVSALKLRIRGDEDRLINAILKNNVQSNLRGLDRHLYELTHRTVLPTLLRNYDRYSMRSGVEIRMPFLDYRIVQFAFSIGSSSKIGFGYTKRIVRDAMKGIIPDEIRTRKSKIGFSSPLLQWFRGPLKEFIVDTITSADYKNCELIDFGGTVESYQKIVESSKATQFDAEDLWYKMQPYFWKKYFWERSLSNK